MKIMHKTAAVRLRAVPRGAVSDLPRTGAEGVSGRILDEVFRICTFGFRFLHGISSLLFHIFYFFVDTFCGIYLKFHILHFNFFNFIDIFFVL